MRLEAGARRVLRAASVFGGQFRRRGRLAPRRRRDRDPALARLPPSEREIVARWRGRGKFPGEDEYAFRHPLLREAAYAMLVGEDRVLGHRLAAAWLEEVGERDAPTLGGALSIAGRLAERAVGWYQRAAEQGRWRATTSTAPSATGSARSPWGPRGRRRWPCSSRFEAEAHKWRGANADAAAAANRAMAVARARHRRRWRRGGRGHVAASGQARRSRRAWRTWPRRSSRSPPGTGGSAQVIATARAATQLALAGFRELGDELLDRA